MEMVPDWTKENLEGIKQSFENVDWEADFQGMSGSAAWDHLKEFIDKETERNAPKKRRRVGTRPLRMNKNSLRLIRKKRRLWRWYTRDGKKDHESFAAYSNVKKEVHKGVRKDKRNLERKLAKNQKMNSKAFFSHNKKSTSKRISVCPFKEGDEIVADNGRMADMLNKFFCSVFTEEDATDFPSVEELYQGADIHVTVEFEPDKVEKKLSSRSRQVMAQGPAISGKCVEHSTGHCIHRVSLREDGSI